MLNAVLVAVAVELLAIPLWGRLTDRVGRRPVFLFGAAVHLVMIVPLFLAVRSGSGLWIQLALLVALPIAHAATYAPQASFFPELFPTRVRYSGMSVVWQFGALVASGPFTVVAAALLAAMGGAFWGVALYVAVLALVSVACLLALPETRRPPRRPRSRGLGPGARAAPRAPVASCARRPRLRCGREDREARVIVTCPGPQLRHAEARHRRRRHRRRRRDAQRPRAGRRRYLRDHVVPAADRPRPGPDRGHLAVPLQGSVLAAGPGHDDARSPPSTRRCGTSRARSPGCRSTSCSAGAAATASPSTATPTRETIDEVLPRGRPLRRAGLPGGAGADRRARAGRPPTASATDRMFYEPADAAVPSEAVWSTERVPGPRAGGVRPGTRASSARTCDLLHDVHHRLTPIEAARLGTSLEPYALTWMEDPVAGRAAGGLPADPAAHDDPDRGRRGVQLDLGLPAADPRAAHRLHPGHGRARRRHHATCAASSTWPPCTTCAAARTAPPTSRRSCMAAALHLDISIPNFGLQEYMRAHAGDRRGLPARLPLRRRLPAPGARRPGSASTSTRRRRRATRTGRAPCR